MCIRDRICIQLRNISALKYLDHEVGIDYLPERFIPYDFSREKITTFHAQQQQRTRLEGARPIASTSWGSLWTSLAAEPDGLEGRTVLLALVIVTEEALITQNCKFIASYAKGDWTNASRLTLDYFH